MRGSTGMHAGMLLVALCCGCEGDFDLDAAPVNELKVMTFNIYNTDAGGESRIHAWKTRREWIVSTIDAFRPDVVGLQEAHMEQVRWIVDRVDGDYGYWGRGRNEDGSGESTSILYREDKYVRTLEGTRWYSDAPAVAGSKWPEISGEPRILTFIRLEHRNGQKGFYVYNTHWPPNSGATNHTRFRAAALLATTIAARPNPEEFFLILGDLNTTPGDPAYKYLRGMPCPYSPSAVEPFALYCGSWYPPFETKDSWLAANQTEGTQCYNSETGGVIQEQTGLRIDYVLVSDPSPGDYFPHVANAGRFLRGASCPSDHYAVVAELALPLAAVETGPTGP